MPFNVVINMSFILGSMMMKDAPGGFVITAVLNYQFQQIL
jgi:hypothetical protein